MATLDEKFDESLILLAAEAGAVIMRHYAGAFDVRRKDDATPVTAADEDAEAHILAGLKTLAPGIPIISEEAASAGHVPAIGGRFFLVDPLDGTKEFVSRNGEFTVNVALIENGAPTRGVVFAPARKRLFAALQSGEAVEIACDAEQATSWRAPLSQARRIHCRPVPKTDMIAVASRTHRDKKTDEYLAHYSVKDFITAGSSLKFCLLAAAEADIYPRHGTTMEWDTAAGHAVLAAAGGSVTLLDGKTPLSYGKAADKFTNPHFVAWGKR
jgi:3'(2'), 5'-bisphosphate nucleotidase